MYSWKIYYIKLIAHRFGKEVNLQLVQKNTRKQTNTNTTTHTPTHLHAEQLHDSCDLRTVAAGGIVGIQDTGQPVANLLVH